MFTPLELLNGVLITEWTFIFAARRVFGKYINSWYTDFGIWALMSDISSILIGIAIALYFYRGKSLLILIGVAVAVQTVHDLLFYTGIIRQLSPGVNGIIDLLKPYAEDAGFAAVIGDSWMMIGSLLFAKLASKLPVNGQMVLALFSLYMLPYAIHQKPSVAN
uniref:Uncharacterized protein n=1 Tax=viral metagenome TaxID=1070528 RepID=A0A6C0I5G5_9ZZZZ